MQRELLTSLGHIALKAMRFRGVLCVLSMLSTQRHAVHAEHASFAVLCSTRRPMMYLALTYDHRLIDGREAVTFLKRIKARGGGGRARVPRPVLLFDGSSRQLGLASAPLRFSLLGSHRAAQGGRGRQHRLASQLEWHRCVFRCTTACRR